VTGNASTAALPEARGARTAQVRHGRYVFDHDANLAGTYSLLARPLAPSLNMRRPWIRHPRIANTEEDPLSDLMERYASGNDEVFDQIYSLLAPRLYRFCCRLATGTSEADDCFQETFLRIHRARGTYQCGANAMHWAFAIARSVYLTRLRYWRRRPETLGMTADVAEREALQLQSHSPATPESEVSADHLRDVLAHTLSSVPEKNRAAYALLKEEGLTAKEAAAVLGTTQDAVKQRAHRVYEKLRAALAAAGW
jgi:RNA polymerase sigma-70 factor (ECF subfamily)